MSKRPADEPVELRAGTPGTPKRARFEEVDDEANISPPTVSNGGVTADDEVEYDGQSLDASIAKTQEGPAEGFSDLYLDTIDRKLLDFGASERHSMRANPS
jgi:U4/U6.U5 tri-snRNP-associated protein 2